MTAAEVIPSQGSTACLQGLHQDSRRVHSAVARLKGSSAQKTFSTCSLAEVLGSVVARSVVAQVIFPEYRSARTLISAQSFPPVLDLGVSGQPAFIHRARDNKRSNNSKLLPVRSSPRFSPSLFSSHSRYSLPSRPFSLPHAYRIRGFHSNPPRDITWRGRRRRSA